jgi:tetratricopeptide (TPR) repeat protein
MARQPLLNIPETVTTEEALFDWIDENSDYLDNPRNEKRIVRSAYWIMRRNPENFSQATKDFYLLKHIQFLMKEGLFYKQSPKELGEKAIRTFQEVLRILPENPIAHYRLAHLYYKDGRNADALCSFIKALDLSRSGEQEFDQLKLNDTQIELSKRLLFGLNFDFLKNYPNGFEVFLESEQFERFRELVVDPIENFVFYSFRSNNTVEHKYISVDEYDYLLSKLSRDTNAFIIDRYNSRPYCKYLNKYDFFYDTSNKLDFLLISLELEQRLDIPGAETEGTRKRTTARLNEDLEGIGLNGNLLRVSYSHPTEKLFAEGTATTHYFKRIFH